jgi:hypothetical protein
MHKRLPTWLPAGLAGLAGGLLLACGGGSGSDDALSSEVAQGYAADASAMPVTTASGLDTATVLLEAGLSSTTALSAPCAGGGTVTWAISGGTLAQQFNGRLDAGETYQVIYANCRGTTPGMALDGRATLTVNAYSATSSDLTSDLTFATSALQLTTPEGRYLLDGSVREQRSSTATTGGGTQTTVALSSSRVLLSSSVGGRVGSYEITALAWTVNRTQDATGQLTARTHQGTLNLAANTPRRPAATLQVATQGVLVLGSDGYAAQGSFSVATNQDLLAVSYGGNVVTITLDLGRDGRIDRSWTLPRTTFIGEVG